MRREILHKLLTGEGSHFDTARVFDGLEPPAAGRRPEGSPHTIASLAGHAAFWQEVYLRRLGGEEVRPPEGADWPLPARPGREEWEETVRRYRRGVEMAIRLAAEGDLEERLPNWEGLSRGEGLAFLAVHNSWHGAQAVLLRRILGAWPPAEAVAPE